MKQMNSIRLEKKLQRTGLTCKLVISVTAREKKLKVRAQLDQVYSFELDNIFLKNCEKKVCFGR